MHTYSCLITGHIFPTAAEHPCGCSAMGVDNATYGHILSLLVCVLPTGSGKMCLKNSQVLSERQAFCGAGVGPKAGQQRGNCCTSSFRRHESSAPATKQRQLQGATGHAVYCLICLSTSGEVLRHCHCWSCRHRTMTIVDCIMFEAI